MKQSVLFLSISFCLLVCSSSLIAQTTILSEDFESGQPAGWNISTLSTDGGWIFGTSGSVASSGFPIPDHTNVAATNDNACSTCDKSADLFVTPSLDLSGKNEVMLSFYYFFYKATANGHTEKATVEVSTDNGNTWTVEKSLSGASGWTLLTIDLSDYDGQPNVQVAFRYNDNGGWLYGWAIDDVTVYEQADVDLSLSFITVGKEDPTPTFIAFPTYLAGFDLSAKISFVNTGNNHITSFDMTLTDGVNTYNQTVTGINVSTMALFSYFFDEPYLVLDGTHTVSVTISNINGAGNDFYAKYNNLSANVTGITPNPDKKYLAEEATGTWCGYCVRGIVFMDYMREQYPDQFVGIAVHNGDPMVLSSYDNPISNLVNGFYPNVVIDRTDVIDPSLLEYDFINRMTETPAAKVSVSAINSGNKLYITTTGEFFQNLTGDYRFACVIVEDSVHGTASGYKQSNYYAGGGLGPMGGFENLAGNIAASQMYYDVVGRALIGGFPGSSGSLPSTINAGEVHSHDFTYSISSTVNMNHVWVAALIINNDNGQVVNVNKTNWEFNTALSDEPLNASLFIYPNPAREVAYLDVRMASTQDVNVTVIDALGRAVSTSSFESVSGSDMLPMNIHGLSAGLYQVQVKVGEQVSTRKLLVAD